jgi:hypothetical protein
MYHLSELAVIPAAGALFLVAFAWINRRETRAMVRVVWGSVALCAVVTAALVFDAQSRGLEVGIPSGWAVIAYSSSPAAAIAAIVFHDSLIYWFSAMLAITSIREMRNGTDRRALAICIAMAIVAVGILVQTGCISIATGMAAAGQRSTFISTLGMFDRFTIVQWTAISAAVAIVPVLSVLLERISLDKYSRRRRQLHPLWRDLTNACPEIVYLNRHAMPRGSRFRLHRTMVEILDCILVLGRYAYKDDNELLNNDGMPVQRQALRLARAWWAKQSGEAPCCQYGAQPFTASDFASELAELGELASNWPGAKAHVEQLTARRKSLAAVAPRGRGATID